MVRNQNNIWGQVPNKTNSKSSIDRYGAHDAVSLNPQGRDSAEYNTGERNKLMQCNKTIIVLTPEHYLKGAKEKN